MVTRAPTAVTMMAVTALMAITGCHGLADGTTQGPPLMTVRGKITLLAGTQVDGPLHLALAWYPGLFDDAGDDAAADCAFAVPLAFVSQSVTYRPTFPIDYAFDITALPPPAAQRAIDAGARGITGVAGALVAYQDGNANGTLDVCADGVACPDRVLGASGSVLPGGLPNQADRLIAYSDVVSVPVPNDGGISPGFYLVQIGLDPASPDAGFLPLPATPVDITLSEAPILRSLTCPRLCVQEIAQRCAVADTECARPAWPKDTSVHCDQGEATPPSPSRSIRWLDVAGCSAQSHAYIVDDGRPLPSWWPCP